MVPPGLGPAAELARQAHAPLAPRHGARPYPRLPPGASAAEVALAATRALVRAGDAVAVRQVVVTVVRDLGGALVPARFEPSALLGLDVSLGLGEPVLVVADPLSLSALHLREVLPALIDDARAVLAGQPDAWQGDSPCPPVAQAEQAAAVPADALPAYVALLERADAYGARALLGRLLAEGLSPAELAAQVLAPAQREVGERWYRGEWTLADELAATTITEGCLSLLHPPDAAPSALPLVTLVAPQGEWHGLPGRLAAVIAHGTRAQSLPPGLTEAQLRRRLEAERPAALALSCTMATSLLPAARLIAAAHAVGVPVVAGGRAFGSDARRASALGADAWTGSASELAGLLPGLRARATEPDVPREALLADALPDAVLLAGWERSRSPWVASLNDVQRRSAVEDLRWVSRHAAAAYAVGDPTLLDEPLRWLRARLRHRQAPAAVLPDAVERLSDAMQAETPAVAALVAAAADRLRGDAA